VRGAADRGGFGARDDAGGGNAGNAGEGDAGGSRAVRAWREGTHDDLVFAVALACWAAKKVHRNPPAGDDIWRRPEHIRESERALREAVGK